MFTKIGRNVVWVLWFMLGLMWAWATVAVVSWAIDMNNQHAYQHANTPAVINTVETIPVEVYKLERED